MLALTDLEKQFSLYVQPLWRLDAGAPKIVVFILVLGSKPHNFFSEVFAKLQFSSFIVTLLLLLSHFYAHTPEVALLHEKLAHRI